MNLTGGSYIKDAKEQWRKEGLRAIDFSLRLTNSIYNSRFPIHDSRSTVSFGRCEIFDQGNKLHPGYHFCAQGMQVIGVDLAVYEFYTLIFQLLHVFNKNVFACITFFTEHTFTKKHFTLPDAIESPHQFAVFPCFGAVGMTGFMKGDISFFHFLCDPGAILLFAGNCFTPGNDFSKSFIYRELESVLIDQAAHAFADVQ